MTVRDVRGPVVYAERHRGLGALEEYSVLDEWSVLPGELTSALERASALVVVDPLSFPFEDLRRHHWGLPMSLVWPTHVDADVAQTLLGPVVLDRLTFFDRVAIDADDVWDRLRQTQSFSQSQRVRRSGEPFDAFVASTVRSHVIAESAHREATVRGVGTLDPLTVRSVENKGVHSTELDAIRTKMSRWSDDRKLPGRLSVAHVGTGVGRLRSAFASARYTAYADGEREARQLGSNYPDVEIRRLAPGRRVSAERDSFDVVAITHALATLGPVQRLNILESTFRALRVGGRLVIVESVLPRSSRRYIGVDDLVRDLLRSSGHGLVVDDVVSLAPPTSPIGDRILVVASKIGVPVR